MLEARGVERCDCAAHQNAPVPFEHETRTPLATSGAARKLQLGKGTKQELHAPARDVPQRLTAPLSCRAMADPTWLSLLPALVTIVLAFATRQVIPALFAGVVTGSLVLFSQTEKSGDHGAAASTGERRRRSTPTTITKMEVWITPAVIAVCSFCIVVTRHSVVPPLSDVLCFRRCRVFTRTVEEAKAQFTDIESTGAGSNRASVNSATLMLHDVTQ